jgi:hypothetical protein
VTARPGTSLGPPGRTPWSLLAYLACALAVFWPVLTAWFVADDWDFLILVARARTPLVSFVPLVGRFIRPLVMLTYYANYHLFGLWTFPYHLTLLLVHVVNAWLVSRLAARLGASGLAAFGSGLIFLVFAGHSEAVSWVAGAADPWLVLFLVTGLLLFGQALEAERPGKTIAGACVVFALGLLAKETAVIAPALVAAYGASALVAPAAASHARRIVTRTLIVAATTAAIAAISLAWRARVFGSVFGAYDQLGTSRGMMAAEARAFLLRSFLPPGRVATGLWVHHYDILLFAAGAIVLGLVFLRNRQARPGIAFLPAALAIALAPALPLTISLTYSVSERYVYVATVFSCILTAWMADLLSGRRRLFAAAVLGVVVLVQARGLVLANRKWIDAGRVGRTVMAEIIAAVRASPAGTRTMVLNAPDTVSGAFVIRGAFLNSFYLMAPDVQRPETRVGMVASTASRSPRDVTRVERTGPRSFDVSLEQGVFVQSGGGESPEYRVERWTETGYAITFKQAPRRVNVLYTSDGHVRPAGVLDASPFGSLDIPADGAACSGESVRFSGWALDDEPGVEVVVERDGAEGGAGTQTGVGTWKVGTRPDVTAYFRDFSGSDRAEWNYWLPCALVRAAGGRLDVRVVAVGHNGQRTALGARTVFTHGPK